MSALDNFLLDVAESVARETHRSIADVRVDITVWKRLLDGCNSLDHLSKYFNTQEFVMSNMIDGPTKRIMREELTKRSRPPGSTSPILRASPAVAKTQVGMVGSSSARDLRPAIGTRAAAAMSIQVIGGQAVRGQLSSDGIPAAGGSIKLNRSFTSDAVPAPVTKPGPPKEKIVVDPVCEVIDRIFQLAQQKVRRIILMLQFLNAQGTSEVKLNGRPLQKLHVKLITKLLRAYPMITTLELRSASLDDTCLSVVANFLRKQRFCSLTSLDISENRFKSSALESLCTALQDNFALISLKIPDQTQDEVATVPTSQKINFVLWANKQYQLVRSNSHVYNIMQIQNRTLTSFPEESLVILEISRCELTSLPPTVAGLLSLTKLNLANNELDAIPGQIGLLTRLEELVLSSNQIAAIPPALFLLVRLKELHLANNKLTELPRFLGGLPDLKALQVGKNPFRKDMVVPKNIVSKGDEAILTYLQALYGVGDGSLDTIKIAFVGPSGAGKTMLVQALRNKDEKKDSKSKTKGEKPPVAPTEGIDVSQMMSDDGSLTINAWDFSGAASYQPTHSFFFTSNTLYLLIANCAEEGMLAKLDYWLSMVNVRAGKAPVVIVGTRLDEASKEQLKAFIEAGETLKNLYKTVCSINAVSSITGKGLKELHKELIRVANAHDWSRRVVPRTYRLMNYRLSALKDTGRHPYFSYAQIQSLATELSVSKGEIPVLTDTLTTIGTIAYCPYVRNANTQLALLDPQWLTNAFAMVLHAKVSGLAKDGVLSSTDLPQVWNSFSPDVHPFLIALFKQYELVYVLPDSSLLVPMTLREQRPSPSEVERARAEFEGKPEASRIFNLSFMPPGLMCRALVRFLTKGWRCHLMWLDGFLVSKDDACAYFEYDAHETLVSINVVAAIISQALNAAIEEMLLLVREYPRLKYTEQIPCPYCNTHRFGMDELKDLASAGQMGQCLSTRTAVPITMLLPGIEVATPRALPGSTLGGKISLGLSAASSMKQSMAETLTCRHLENVILEHHRLSFSHTLTERMLKECEARREEVSQNVIDATTQGAQLSARVNDLHNAVTTKAIAQQIAGLDLKDCLKSSMTSLAATSGSLREEIVGLEDQLADAKLELLKSTARRPGSTIPPNRKSKKLDITLAAQQLASLEIVLQKLETMTSAPSVLQAHNERLETKRKQYEAGLKTIKEQITALETLQAEMVKESLQISADCERLRTVQKSLSVVDSLARKGELLEPKGTLSPGTITALSAIEANASDLKSRYAELGYLPATLPAENELDFPDLKLIKQDSSEHPTPRAGTIPRLVERLTWSKHPDFAYQAAFMLTYRSFLAPLELLQCLVLRYCAVPAPGADPVAVLDQQVPIKLRVLSVLRYWVDNFYDDFRLSPDLLDVLINFLDNVVGLSGNKQFVTQIKAALDKKRDGQERMRPINKGPPQPPQLPEAWPMGGRWTMMDVEAVEFARQLTLLALELLQSITPSELIGAAWTKADKNIRSPNIMKSIQHFNKLSMHCLEDIVRREDPILRRNVLRRWIVIAKECLRLNNYSSCLALVAALEHTGVHRLKKTWASVGDDIQALYGELSPFTGSNYPKLKEMVRTGPRPCVPYLGLYLTDLVFSEELPDVTEEGLTNFMKNRKVAAIIQQIAQYQELSYPFTPVPEIREMLLSLEEKDEEALLQLSFKVEPKAT